MKMFIIVLFFGITNFLQAQDAKIDPKQLLQAGPMLGYSQMREVMLWVQTVVPAQVQIKYWDLASPSPVFETEIISTQKESAYTAHLLANQVVPGHNYGYKVYINNDFVEFDYPLVFKSAPDWRYKTETPDFSVAVGSCFYANDPAYDRNGKPYGGDYKIFEAINDKKPDLMLWLGDNTYYREADWETKTGMQYRNTHSRSVVELQPLLANTHHFAVWDDHDYGPNDHNRTFINKAMSLDVFKTFWANQHYGFLDENCAVTQWSWGDVDFYMLDNRWFRTANNLTNGEKIYFGKKQIDWLIENLKASSANFKIIASGGQLLNTAKVFENYANYEEERAYFLKRLEEEKIEGVFILSGDRHHTVLSELPRENSYNLRELTVSPLTSGAHAPQENNELAVKNTTIVAQNFAILTFSGKSKNRSLKTSVYNKEGALLWEKQFELTEFKSAK